MTSDDQKPLSLIEIAKLAGTSKSTVSRVLRNQPRVSPVTRKRVQEVIKAQGFRPNVLARGLTGARTGMIALLCRWMESDFASEVIRGADVEIQSRGDHLLSSFAHASDAYIDLWLNFVGGGQIDGIILVAPPAEIFDQTIRNSFKPIVMCAAQPTAGKSEWEKVDRVMLDNESGMRRAVEHLIQQGYTRLAHLEGPPNNFDGERRRESFQATVAQHRGVTGRIIHECWNEEMAYWRMVELLKKDRRACDAYMAFNDGIAIGVLRALREAGVAVPGEAAVVGWDDSRFAGFAELTTVNVPMSDIGRQAAVLLYNQINAKKANAAGHRVLLDTSLSVRRSSGKAVGT